MQHAGGRMTVTISIDALGDELRRRRDDRKLSLRDVEQAIGESAATLSRIERGSTPDLDIVMKLATWLGVVIHAAGNQRAPKSSDEELKRTIELHLRANKKLTPELARSIADSFDFVMRVEMERAATKKK